MSPLDVRSLSFKRGSTPILQNLNCSFDYGSTVAILGANGSGKTTLLHLLSGFHRLQGGEIWQNGTCIGRPGSVIDTEFRRKSGVVFQEPSLDPCLSAYENLLLNGRLYSLAPDLLKKKIAQSLEWAALSDRAHEPVKKFSGGMKKKLEIMRALMHEPNFLLLDEASSGLDYLACHRFWEKIEAEKARGSAIVMVTHRIDEIEKCDRVLMVHDGAVIAQGSPANLAKQTGGDRISIQLKDGSEAFAQLGIKNWFGVEKYSSSVDGEIRIVAANGQDIAARIVHAAPENSIRSVTVRPASVVDAYFLFTGVDIERM